MCTIAIRLFIGCGHISRSVRLSAFRLLSQGGKVTIIPGHDGNPLLPSVVSFLNDGAVAVGHDAVDLLESEPASTIYGAKRFIGRA